MALVTFAPSDAMQVTLRPRVYRVELGPIGFQGVQGPPGDLDATNFTAKGDVLVGTGVGTFDQLAVGAAGEYPIADPTATTGLSWLAPPHLDVTDPRFGAIGDGVTDDTTAINAAGALAGTTGSPLFFPPGQYVYNGTGLSHQNPVLLGAGRALTTILLGATSWFYHRTSVIHELTVSGFTFSGGLGAIRQSGTGSDSWLHRHIDACDFLDYTQAAISDLGSDTPYWKISRCYFRAANFTSTIGIAIGGNPDSCDISNCSFWKNRVHIKMTKGLSNNIRGCDFFRNGASAGNPRIDIWMVPTAIVGQGGMVVSECKFGPENLELTDWRIVVADQDAGTDFSTRWPLLSTASTNVIQNVNVRDCMLAGVAASSDLGPPLLYTTTASLIGFNLGPINLGTNTPRMLVQCITPLPSNYSNAEGNVLGPILGHASFRAPIPPTNCPRLWTILDPHQYFEGGALTQIRAPGGGNTIGYVNLCPTLVNAFSLSNATKAGITDAKGGTDAIEVTQTSPVAQSGVFATVGSTIAINNMPVFVEFDMKVGSSDPLSLVQVSVGPNPAFEMRRLVAPRASWTRYRYSFIPQASAGSAFWIVVGQPGYTATGTKFQLGRVRVYHAREPIPADLDVRVATTTTTAPAAGGASALPATPAGYMTVYINGVARQIPYY